MICGNAAMLEAPEQSRGRRLRFTRSMIGKFHQDNSLDRATYLKEVRRRRAMLLAELDRLAAVRGSKSSCSCSDLQLGVPDTRPMKSGNGNVWIQAGDELVKDESPTSEKSCSPSFQERLGGVDRVTAGKATVGIRSPTRPTTCPTHLKENRQAANERAIEVYSAGGMGYCRPSPTQGAGSTSPNGDGSIWNVRRLLSAHGRRATAPAGSRRHHSPRQEAVRNVSSASPRTKPTIQRRYPDDSPAIWGQLPHRPPSNGFGSSTGCSRPASAFTWRWAEEDDASLNNHVVCDATAQIGAGEKHVLSDPSSANSGTFREPPPPPLPLSGKSKQRTRYEIETPSAQRARIIELKRLATERKELEAQLAQVKRLMRAAASRRTAWVEATTTPGKPSTVTKTNKLAPHRKKRKRRRRRARSAECTCRGEIQQAARQHRRDGYTRKCAAKPRDKEQRLRSLTANRSSLKGKPQTARESRSARRRATAGESTGAPNGTNAIGGPLKRRRASSPEARQVSAPTSPKPEWQKEKAFKNSRSKRTKSASHRSTERKIDRPLNLPGEAGTRMRDLRGRRDSGKCSHDESRIRPASAFGIQRRRDNTAALCGDRSISPMSSVERRRRERVQESAAAAILASSPAAQEGHTLRPQLDNNEGLTKSRYRGAGKRKTARISPPSDESSDESVDMYVDDEFDEDFEMTIGHQSYESDFEVWEDDGSSVKEADVDDDHSAIWADHEHSVGGKTPTWGTPKRTDKGSKEGTSPHAHDESGDSHSTWDLESDRASADGFEGQIPRGSSVDVVESGDWIPPVSLDAYISDGVAVDTINENIDDITPMYTPLTTGIQNSGASVAPQTSALPEQSASSKHPSSKRDNNRDLKSLLVSSSEDGSSIYDIRFSSRESSSDFVGLRRSEAAQNTSTTIKSTKSALSSRPPSGKRVRPASARLGLSSATSRTQRRISATASSEDSSALFDIQFSSSNNSTADPSGRGGRAGVGHSAASSRMSGRSLGSGTAAAGSLSSTGIRPQPTDGQRRFITVGSYGHVEQGSIPAPARPRSRRLRTVTTSRPETYVRSDDRRDPEEGNHPMEKGLGANTPLDEVFVNKEAFNDASIQQLSRESSMEDVQTTPVLGCFTTDQLTEGKVHLDRPFADSRMPTESPSKDKSAALDSKSPDEVSDDKWIPSDELSDGKSSVLEPSPRNVLSDDKRIPTRKETNGKPSVSNRRASDQVSDDQWMSGDQLSEESQPTRNQLPTEKLASEQQMSRRKLPTHDRLPLRELSDDERLPEDTFTDDPHAEVVSKASYETDFNKASAYEIDSLEKASVLAEAGFLLPNRFLDDAESLDDHLPDDKALMSDQVPRSTHSDDEWMPGYQLSNGTSPTRNHRYHGQPSGDRRMTRDRSSSRDPPLRGQVSSDVGFDDEWIQDDQLPTDNPPTGQLSAANLVKNDRVFGAKSLALDHVTHDQLSGDKCVPQDTFFNGKSPGIVEKASGGPLIDERLACEVESFEKEPVAQEPIDTMTDQLSDDKWMSSDQISDKKWIPDGRLVDAKSPAPENILPAQLSDDEWMPEDNEARDMSRGGAVQNDGPHNAVIDGIYTEEAGSVERVAPNVEAVDMPPDKLSDDRWMPRGQLSDGNSSKRDYLPPDQRHEDREKLRRMLLRETLSASDQQSPAKLPDDRWMPVDNIVLDSSSGIVDKALRRALVDKAFTNKVDTERKETRSEEPNDVLPDQLSDDKWMPGDRLSDDNLFSVDQLSPDQPEEDKMLPKKAGVDEKVPGRHQLPPGEVSEDKWMPDEYVSGATSPGGDEEMALLPKETAILEMTNDTSDGVPVGSPQYNEKPQYEDDFEEQSLDRESLDEVQPTAEDLVPQIPLREGSANARMPIGRPSPASNALYKPPSKDTESFDDQSLENNESLDLHPLPVDQVSLDKGSFDELPLGKHELVDEEALEKMRPVNDVRPTNGSVNTDHAPDNAEDEDELSAEAESCDDNESLWGSLFEGRSESGNMSDAGDLSFDERSIGDDDVHDGDFFDRKSQSRQFSQSSDDSLHVTVCGQKSKNPQQLEADSSRVANRRSIEQDSVREQHVPVEGDSKVSRPDPSQASPSSTANQSSDDDISIDEQYLDGQSYGGDSQDGLFAFLNEDG